ncbi:MAG: XRE family transcriptional regulator [Curvibacter sp.]|nr:MAG: XRE family transcriptional regulator [Curvibacter sp.]
MPRILHSTPYVQLRQLLREAREAADLTQAQLADRLGRPQSFVSKYESGERYLDVIEFVDVCHGLGVPPAVMLELLTD